MSEGQVTEQGTHDDLVARDGHYANLARSQQIDPGSSNEKLISDDDSHRKIKEAEETVEDLTEKQFRDLDGGGSADVSNSEKKTESLGLARTLAFIVKNNSEENPILILGLCFSIIAGLSIPGQLILFAKALETLSFAPSRYHQPRNDIDILKVEPGQSVALVGGSRSGKSTLFALVERFYSPNRGSVLVGGRDVSKLHLGRYRQILSLVSQEVVLNSGSIRENIALGIPDQNVPDEAIWAACKQTNIHDFVASLQDGLSTLVGPGDSMISGGEKQRIAIARALLRQPKILLLDEATSALDTESERLVQAALEAAANDGITLMIAHRLSTVRKADRIYVLSQGTLVESGTHERLLAKKGKYWEFVKMQNLH
ncbi:P-loop containing nucleoside triphosphate hydrolase protein [Lasiosphaeris hirsuta]|uniref:P-loop containing nucleoside triphosphate hydrolase protein n=1 Tax=Lasiosphaeris hirsuta TaxID=260670 RepID=A0AA40B913_9PEZI|nr:P-loop containing nucleoside triphosphate hydrolase protein [Lasiosphaeris hirsuta]